MPLEAPSWTMVPIRAKYVQLNGNPVVGTVTFTPRAPRMVHVPDGMAVIGTPIRVSLVNGTLNISLPATDDPDSDPTGFTYTVLEEFVGGATYDISVPSAAAAAGIDLAPLAPSVPPSAGTVQTVVRAEFDALAQAVAGLGNRVVVVPHGNDANFPRPADVLVAYWKGAAEPINALEDDQWSGDA